MERQEYTFVKIKTTAYEIVKHAKLYFSNLTENTSLSTWAVMNSVYFQIPNVDQVAAKEKVYGQMDSQFHENAVSAIVFKI